MHQCHIVCWVGQPAFEGTLFIIGARFLLKNPSTVLIALPGSFFNLAFANDAGQLDALVVSVQGKRARRKHFSMTRSQMMAQILHEGECSHFHQDAKFASHQIGMWLFCTIGPAGDPWSSSFQRSFFFFGIVPRRQPHLPLGFVGGACERSGWCFVEACAVSCEHLTQTETRATHVCFFACA